MGVLKKMGYHLKLVKLSQVLDQGGKCNVIRSLKKKNWIFSSSKCIYQRNEIFNMTGPNETYSNFTSFALFSTEVYCINNLSLNSFTEKRKKREHLASEHLLTRKKHHKGCLP